MEGKVSGAPRRRWRRTFLFLATLVLATLGLAPAAFAQEGGGEANLILPSLGDVKFHGASGQWLLGLGLIIVFLGLIFGLAIFFQIRRLPAHRSMREISELIWQTCKTYLMKQGRFLIILWVDHQRNAD